MWYEFCECIKFELISESFKFLFTFFGYRLNGPTAQITRDTHSHDSPTKQRIRFRRGQTRTDHKKTKIQTISIYLALSLSRARIAIKYDVVFIKIYVKSYDMNMNSGEENVDEEYGK